MLIVFSAITLIFIAAVIARRTANFRFCAICLGISATWVGLLVLYRLNKFHDTTLLALLMGQSVSGLYYFLKDRLPKVLAIFTLPFFLTMTAVFYALITSYVLIPVLALLAVLWVGAWLIFSSRNDPGRKDLAQATMNCCEEKK